MWTRAGALLFAHGEKLYNFEGLRRYKDKFKPVWEPRYLAAPGGLALAQVLADVTVLVSGSAIGVVAQVGAARRRRDGWHAAPAALDRGRVVGRAPMGFTSAWHWIIVLLVVVIVFGAGKIPRVMGDVAKGIKSFKAGLKDDETTPVTTTNNDSKVG